MKKCLVVWGFVFTMVISCLAYSATYVVQEGDNLTRISRLTGFKVKTLAKMNGIKNPDYILVGQVITYFNREDLRDAKAWCEKRMAELPLFDENYGVFKYVAKDIDARNFRYSVLEPSGTHFSLVISFAEALRRNL